jgi:Protein of unknown function (DUF2630)
MKQDEVLTHIEKLTEEEQRLYTKGDLTSKEKTQLHEIEEELNQYWDLLRQRRALRETGGDPEKAKLRSQDKVDHYKQ